METGYNSGRTPLRAYKPQPTYEAYISPYGPKYAHPALASVADASQSLVKG